MYEYCRMIFGGQRIQLLLLLSTPNLQSCLEPTMPTLPPISRGITQGRAARDLQGYLDQKTKPNPLGPPEDHRHRPTVGS